MTAPVTSPMLTGIDKAITIIVERLEAQEHTSGGTLRGGTAEESVQDLNLFLTRLTQIHDLMQQDPRLLEVVDASIGQQVQAMEKRQQHANIQMAVITTLVGAILGWLTAALASPLALLHVFVH